MVYTWLSLRRPSGTFFLLLLCSLSSGGGDTPADTTVVKTVLVMQSMQYLNQIEGFRAENDLVSAHLKGCRKNVSLGPDNFPSRNKKEGVWYT